MSRSGSAHGAHARRERYGRRVVIGVPLLWLLLFFLVPFVIVVKISLSQSVLAIPPYASLLQWTQAHAPSIRLHLDSYRLLFSDRLYLDSFIYSVRVAAGSTLCCLALGYPMALAIARAPPQRRALLLMLIILPFWTSFLLRVYAWIALLQDNGVINHLLQSLRLIERPLQMVNTTFAVYLGIVYSYLPFMVLPLYANLEKQDPALLEAAADLGAHPWRSFWRVTVPLSMPGVMAGVLLVFIPAVGEFVIPSLLGPANQLMIGRVLSNEFFENRDWPVASVVALAMLLVLLLPIVLLQRYRARELAEAAA
ncbi:MAG TPA: ABC transporter permease subunit [Steroidobacteraceae bacterium]|nr:ABC transporter permease subunit [Steroidobacteraceae bacterium]